jgi:hypothetical protein
MVYYVHSRPLIRLAQGATGAQTSTTLNGLLGHPQQSSLRPFPHKRGRKLWGLPLVTHRSCIAARRPHLVGLGLAVPSPGVPLAPPFLRPVSDSCVGVFQ